MVALMVERVARALCRADGIDPDGRDSQGRPWWPTYIQEARSAISAMIEPTDDMVIKEAGNKAGRVDLYRADDPSYNVRDIWSSMCNSALGAE